ncbi:methyltransferase domain-containing protein [Frankia sp. CiP3]|uniref:methyltransferase domain-containing protein n=1 Tax=Frankia sp. CiP3 TaxID=2880971 RepID=UPI001EF3E4F5|nr:methyltransferase domain-containing protein [Frankia sp. CiP3]
MPAQRLLDAGCGGGEVARTIAAKVAPVGEVIALDFSAAALAVAVRRHDGSAVHYVEGDVAALDFPDSSFDGVRCERVLQHVTDPDQAIAELVRVTRPGGRVCLIDTDWESMAVDGLPEELVATLKRHLYNQVLCHPSMGRTLRRRLVRAGATEIEATPVTCCFADPGATTSVLPMFDARMSAATGMIPDGIRDEWFAAVDTAAARNEFLATLTIWVATGRRSYTPSHAAEESL